MKILMLYPNLHMMLVPSTAIGLFTSILKKNNFDVDLFDTTCYKHPATTSAEKRVETLQYRQFDPESDLGFIPIPGERLISDFKKKINEFEPDLILVSVVEDTFLQAIDLISSVEQKNIPTVYGGVFITAAPEKAIQYKEVQMLGVGEGEDLILNVAKNIRDGKSLDTISNLWIKKENGEIIRNKPGPLKNISIESPDFSLFDSERFMRPMGGRNFRTLPLETFRGCPFKCSFCNSPMQIRFSKDNSLGNYMRTKNSNIIRNNILKLIEKYNPEYFYILDDSFMSRSRQEMDDFIEMYSEFKIPFWVNTRPETVKSEVLSGLMDVGLDRMSVGLEHGNYDYRKNVLKRNPTNEQIFEHLEIIANSGVVFSVNTIIGMVDETREMIFETIEFCRKLRGYDAITVSIFTPYHGTELRSLAVKNNYLDENVLTTHTTSSSLLNMPFFNSEEIDGMFRTFIMYTRFEKELWPFIKKAEKFDREGNDTWKKLYHLYQKRYYSIDQDGKNIELQIPDNITIKHPKGDHWEEVFGPMSKTQLR